MKTTKELSLKISNNGDIIFMNDNSLNYFSYLKIDSMSMSGILESKGIAKFMTKLNKSIQEQSNNTFKVNIKTHGKVIKNALCEIVLCDDQVSVFFYVTEKSKRDKKSLFSKGIKNTDMNFFLAAPSYS